MVSPFIVPQLATAREKVPTEPGWIHEIKWDGYRMLAYIEAGARRLISRKGLDWSLRFPEVTGALKAIKVKDAILDGEIVTLNEKGGSDFGRLQAMVEKGQRVALAYVLFDLIQVNGQDLRDRPLRERKARLGKLLPKKHAVLQFAEHLESDGVEFFVHACGMGLEGIVSKKADAPYVSGRTTTWIKVKCVDAREFTVVGYLPSERRSYFKSLIVGERTAGGIVYRGLVGGGFTEPLGHKVAKMLELIETENSSLVEVPWNLRNKARWVLPVYVVTVKFTEITRDGVLRHPRFMLIRHSSEPGAGEHLRSLTLPDQVKRRPRKIRPKPALAAGDPEELTKVLRRSVRMPQRAGHKRREARKRSVGAGA